MKRILISGGNGRLCGELLKANAGEHSALAPDRSDMDITDPLSIDAVMDSFRPDVFIHAAALTKPLSAHENIAKSIDANIIGTCNVVKACAARGVKLVYISTDYVYQKESEDAKETDPVLPFTKYGWSKMGGECAVVMYDGSLILRGAFFESPFPYDQAYTNVVKNQMYQTESARIILSLLDEKGVINIGSEKAQSIYQFAQKTKPEVKPVEFSGDSVSKRLILNTERMRSALKKD